MFTQKIWILIILILIPNPCESVQWFQQGNPHFLDTNNVFDTIKQPSTIKVLKFFSPWCKYCRYIKVYVDNYKNTHQIQQNFKFYEFNCQSNGAMFCAQHFQVRAYPAVLFINENGDTISRIDGLYPENVIFQMLDELNGKAKVLKEIKQNKEDANVNLKVQAKVEEQKVKENNKQEQKLKEQEKKQEEKTENNKVQNQQQKKQKQEIVEKKQQLKQVVAPPKQQEQKKAEQKKPIQVNQKIVSQKSLETQAQTNSQKIDAQNQVLQLQNSKQTSHFLKYLIYIAILGVVVLYGYKIFLSHSEDTTSIGPPSLKNPVPEQKLMAPKRIITSRDVQSEVMIEEVTDENL